MAKEKASKWVTLQCVVRYRTSDPNLSERDLTRHVQYLLDQSQDRTYRQSKVVAVPFKQALSRMLEVRPKRLQSAIRALDSAVDRLRRL